jgi:hypothetical protein
MLIGFFFFIRASVKERIDQIKFTTEQTEESLLNKLEQYFKQRAYKVVGIDGDKNQVIFEGFVSPSWFLAIFLSFLAGLGLLCLALVLYLLFSSVGTIFFLIVLLAPIAGIFYWRKAGRLEKVYLNIEPLLTDGELPKQLITITAHRDELIQLQEKLNF